MSEGSGISLAGWVSTIVCLLLQVLLAPHIAIAGATPLFLAIPLAVVATSSGTALAVAFAFLLGLVYDLGTGTPLGSMSMAFSLAALVMQLLGRTEGGTGVSLGALAAAVVVAEVVQGILLAMTGYATSAGPVLVRMLVGSLYTSAIAAIGLAIVRAIRARRQPMGPSGRLFQ